MESFSAPRATRREWIGLAELSAAISAVLSLGVAVLAVLLLRRVQPA